MGDEAGEPGSNIHGSVCVWPPGGAALSRSEARSSLQEPADPAASDPLSFPLLMVPGNDGFTSPKAERLSVL